MITTYNTKLQKNQIQCDFPASVYEVVISGCQNDMGLFSFYNKKQKEIAQMNMEKIKITDLKNKCFHELSGGQQQKVLLARALCATNSLLLLDEPVSGIDQNGMELFYKTITYLKEHYDH